MFRVLFISSFVLSTIGTKWELSDYVAITIFVAVFIVVVRRKRVHSRFDRVIMSFSVVTKWTKQISIVKRIVRIFKLLLSSCLKNDLLATYECDFYGCNSRWFRLHQKNKFRLKRLHLRLYYLFLFANKKNH